MIALLLLSFLLSCNPVELPKIEKQADGLFSMQGYAMTMPYKILLGQDLDEAQLIRITEIVAKTFNQTDNIFNKWNPNSELSQLNAQKGGVETPLSPLLQRLFNETDRIVVLSEGRFDPTIESIQQLWKEKLKLGKKPDAAEIEAIAPAVGWNKISFDRGVFKKEHDLTKLDFGGIAKGLCIDMIIENLQAAGFQNLYVEWGGEIRVSGKHPEGRPWTVFISNLGDSDPKNGIATLELEDQAIATSGDYLQNWRILEAGENGEEHYVSYFHIFDPKTLKPLKVSRNSIASVSVVGSNCALADGLATILMMFPNADEALEWAEEVKKQYPDIAFWVVNRDIGR